MAATDAVKDTQAVKDTIAVAYAVSAIWSLTPLQILLLTHTHITVGHLTTNVLRAAEGHKSSPSAKAAQQMLPK